MRVRPKREVERLIYERFQGALPSAPRGRVTQPDPPAPDIVVVSDDGEHGIEITRVLAESWRRTESEQDQAVQQAATILSRLRPRAVHIQVSWYVGAAATRRRSEVAEAIASVIRPHLSGATDRILVPREELAGAGLTDIESITITFPPGGTEVTVFCPRASFVGPASVATVQAAISRKAARLHRPSGYVSHWLLLAAGTGGPASWYLAPDNLREHIFEAPIYDEVYFMDLAHDEVHRLSLAHHQSPDA